MKKFSDFLKSNFAKLFIGAAVCFAVTAGGFYLGLSNPTAVISQPWQGILLTAYIIFAVMTVPLFALGTVGLICGIVENARRQ